MTSEIFDKYRAALRSQTLTAVWRGHGSAIFLEFGQLSPRFKRDGSAGKPRGTYGIMIEWSWRIESDDAILCGSWSEEAGWDAVLNALVGHDVEDISHHGRLPELTIALAGGHRVASFMTAEGQPAWAVFDRSSKDDELHVMAVEKGRICEHVERRSETMR
jgi:hypothetical protein